MIPKKPAPDFDPGWIPVLGKACPRARPEGSCANNKVERDDDAKKSHLALSAGSLTPGRVPAGGRHDKRMRRASAFGGASPRINSATLALMVTAHFSTSPASKRCR